MLPRILIFGTSISTYWLMFFIGLVGMAVICWKRTKFYRFSGSGATAVVKGKSVIFTLLLAMFGLLGTKLLYIIENLQETLENGITLGGQSFFGALFLVPIAVSLYGRVLGLKPLEATDYCAPPVIFILMCMRLGCFMNGCCGGIMIGTFQVPVQLIEAIGDACIFSFLLYYEDVKKRKGILYPFLMGTYGILRFFLEFLRDTPKDLLFISRGQLFSILALLIAVIWIVRVNHEKNM